MSKREKIGGVGKSPAIDLIAGMKVDSKTAAVVEKVADRVLAPVGNFYSRMPKQQTMAPLSAGFGGGKRKQAILNHVEPLLAERFAKGRQKIESDCEINGEVYRKKLCGEIRGIITNGWKQDAALSNLVVSPLHSSRLMKNHQLNIGLYTDELYLEKDPAVGKWDAGWIYNHFAGDMEWAEKKIEEEFPRLQGYELDIVEDAYIWNYHGLAQDFVGKTVPNILKLPEFQQLQKGSTFSVLFGEGMEAANILYQEES